MRNSWLIHGDSMFKKPSFMFFFLLFHYDFFTIMDVYSTCGL